MRARAAEFNLSRMEVLLWKFPIAGKDGENHLRVKHIGEEDQQVFLNGESIIAPPGTSSFTGPCASLLELVCWDEWVLLVDGLAVRSQRNEVRDTHPPIWWKFTVTTVPGVHLMRGRNIGTAGQEFILDGICIDAPQVGLKTERGHCSEEHKPS